MNPTPEQARQLTTLWLERAVIGLKLCPFANAVHAKRLVHLAVSSASQPQHVMADLHHEVDALMQADPKARETTLLIAPYCFAEFLEFTDFLKQVNRLLQRLDLDGILQLASFHPRYQFANVEPDDITNCTNRSPFPTLHLLREQSVDRAVAVFPGAQQIVQTNMETMRKLGVTGWTALADGWAP